MWLLSLAIAAFLSAVMDITENENFYSSRLKKLNPKFWYKRESWKHAKKLFGWKFDAWHVAKSLMVIFCVGSIFLYYYAPWWFIEIRWQNVLKDFAIAGVAWNAVFNVSYKLLKT